MTHAAVSHQIRALEEWFSVSLFERSGRQIRLTETGARLLAPLSSALDNIADAVRQVCDDAGRRVLTVSAAPSVAYKLVVPRLGVFSASRPDVEVHLHHSTALANFVTDGVDVGIRFGRGEWPGTVARRIMDGYAQPFASPMLLERFGISLTDLPLSAERIGELPLHHEDTTNYWRRWFEMAGGKRTRFGGGTVYHDGASILNVAVAGQGVVLARPALADVELSQGMLVPLSDLKIDEDTGYYLVYPKDKASDPLIQAFEEWVMSDLAQLA